MNATSIEECARCFIRRIGSADRRSKRVDLLHEEWNRTLGDPTWIRGALQTTALRKRPNGISRPAGSLRYAVGKERAACLAMDFLSNVSFRNPQDYDGVLFEICGEMEITMNNLGFHWTFGRSQKFFNILTKYWFCVAVGYPEALNEPDRALVSSLQDRFHAPIDSVTLRHLSGSDGLPSLRGVYWGWNMTREKYQEIQGFLGNRAAKRGFSKIECELAEIW